MNIIDLRSDTVTKPSPEMLKAMLAAEVGDDVFGDDPTVNELENYTAELLKKEAGLFFPSGTMSNQIALRSHTQPGDEMLIDENSHIYWYEGGGPAALSGVSCRLLPGKRGIFSANDVKESLRPRDQHFPITKILALENTHARGGGSVWPLDTLKDVIAVAKEASLITHLDGARLWNASAATGIPEWEYASYFDSVSVCFSKGLGAPIGSVLVGSQKFINRAHRFRKQFGGGMRQVGFVAAAALYAVKNNRKRLVDDHENAILMGEGINEIPGVNINLNEIETNLVFIHLKDDSANEVAKQLKERDILVLSDGPNKIRVVMNYMVEQGDIHNIIETFQEILN